MEPLLQDGVKLLFVGLLTVLSFIGCVILVTLAIGWMTRHQRKPVLAPIPRPRPVPDDEESHVAAAIAAAARFHLEKRSSNE